jgi:hypothetical protein
MGMVPRKACKQGDAIHCQHKKIDCPQRKVGGWVWQEMMWVGLILVVE